MNVSPRFLFLFKAQPIYIESKLFKKCHSIIMTFISNGRKPRLKMKSLKLPEEMGGLNLPNLQAYYQASQVQIIKVWMLESSHIRWREMELNCGDFNDGLMKPHEAFPLFSEPTRTNQLVLICCIFSN